MAKPACICRVAATQHSENSIQAFFFFTIPLIFCFSTILVRESSLAKNIH